MRITLRQLEAFLAVARLGSLSAAAHHLCLTKGAVSATVQALEQQLGEPLFDRSNNRLRLNARGRSLQPEADAIISRALALEQGQTQQSGWHDLRLGASNSIGTYLVPELLASLYHRSEYRLQPLPHVIIGNSSELAAQLLNFALDLALVEGNLQHPEILLEPWLIDPLVVIAPQAHPLVAGARHGRQAPLPLAALSHQQWVVRETGSGSRAQFEALLQPALPWDQALELPSTEAVVRAVAAGLGLALVSATVLPGREWRQQLAIIPLQQPLQRQLHLAIHRAKEDRAGLASLRAACRAWKPRMPTLD